MKLLRILTITACLCLSGCAISQGIGTATASFGYVDPVSGLNGSIGYTKTFTDGKTLKPLRGLAK
jgi:hypothetical protein